MKVNEDYVRKVINEELSTQEVKNIINNKLSSFIKEKEFEKKVKEITSDIFEHFFKNMYNKRGFWKNDLKNG